MGDFQMRVNVEGVVSLLRANLIDRYRDCFCIIQELLQNADDANASRVHFGVSQRLDVNHPLGRLPALYIINDGPVSYSNMEAIYTVASGDKGNESGKIGKFGLGMKSVFHICEGFFMFGQGLSEELTFPYFCTPWTKEYHEDWFDGIDDAMKEMDSAVRGLLKDVVADWNRWFCVWLPLREESLHKSGLTQPIMQMYPKEFDIAEFTGLENAIRAAHMLPLLRHVDILSFVDSSGKLRRFKLDNDVRMVGESGRFGGVVHASGEGIADFRFFGIAEKVVSESFLSLRRLHCWPSYTRFVKDGITKGFKSFPDKTDSHVALCFITERSERPRLTVAPCVYLPLSDVWEDEVREGRGEKRVYTKLNIGGKSSVTIYLHGNLFVDAGRQKFTINAPINREPETETELQAEWNRRIYEDGILPRLAPELYAALQGWDDETASAVMESLRDVPFFSRWIANVCRSEGIARELTVDGYKWSLISSSDEVYAIDPPRSPIVRKVIAAALPKNAHVIDATAGKLLKPNSVRSEFTPEIGEQMLRVIVSLAKKESDNKLLRLFAQECASRLDIGSLDEGLRDAAIWEASDGLYSYDQLRGLLNNHRLYCHAEGDLRELFLGAVECSPIQVNEPLAKSLGLNVPDFTCAFALDILQDGPKLYGTDARRRLLERLLHTPHEFGDAKWIKACRYLVHGEPMLLECADPLFMPVDGEYHVFSEKIVNTLSRHRYGASCKIPRSITDVLDRNRQNELKLPLSTAEGLVCSLVEIGDLSADGFSNDDWRSLVMMVQNLENGNVVDALRRIPLYPTEDGRLTSLVGNTYYERVYLVAPQLRRFVRILNVDGDERLMRRLYRLATKWNPNECIVAADRYLDNMTDFAAVVVDALTVAENINLEVAELLRRKKWVRMSNGCYLSPQSIMNLPCVSGMVPGCDTISEVADVATMKAIRRHALFLGQQSSVNRLFDAMSNTEGARFALGEFKNAAGEHWPVDVGMLLSVFPEDMDETLPAVGVLRRLRENHVIFQEYLPKLMMRIPMAVLITVLTTLTDRIKEDNVDSDDCWSILLPYLDEVARCPDFVSVILPMLRFRNKKGSLKKAGDLCVAVDGVPNQYLLDDRYLKAKDFKRSITQTKNSQKSYGSEKYLSLQQYFAGWDSDFDDRIGGFIVCCTDQPEELDIVKSRFGFENKSIAESRKSIAEVLDEYLDNQHCYIIATPDEQMRVIAINGEEMSISVTPLSGATNLFCGQFNACEIVKNTALWSMGNPPKPDEAHSLILQLRKPDTAMLSSFSPKKLDELLKNTLATIIQAYGFVESDVDAYWESLKNVEQLDVRVTKSVILQSLDMYLPQIRCKNEVLTVAFKESRRFQYGEEQARLNGDYKQESAYRAERMELHRRLETRIIQEDELQNSILEALRERVRGFSYNIDSILFELFQNADDACEEMHHLCGHVQINMPDRFDVRFDGHNLIVAHWGRPINQAKVGSESNSKFDEYRVDLQKMILLSQSGKDVEGVLTKGLYGLGFKSVFLICDIPCILSGKLRFKIVGGLLPEPLDEEEDLMVRKFTREFESVSSGVKPTVFILPLLKEVREDVAKAVRHFAQEVKVLGIFSRRIRTISVQEPSGSVTSVDFSCDNGVDSAVIPCGSAGEYLRVDTDEATLLMGANNGLPASLPSDVATYWVTCPTSVRAGLGVAINANLKLDTGRLILDPKSTKNGEVLSRTADALYAKLVNWIKSLPSGRHYETLAALYYTLTGGTSVGNWDESHPDARAMFNVLWGEHGAYRRAIEVLAAIPSELEGEYRVLCKLRDIEWMVDDDVMGSGLVGTVNSARFKPGNVVARKRFWAVGQVFFPDVLREIASYDIVRFLSDLASRSIILSPEWCNANAERLYALVRPQLDRKEVCDIVRGFEFETVVGTGCKPIKLLIIEDEGERLRAKFLPDDHILSSTYGAEARKLVKLFRCGDYIKAEDLAAFALMANDADRREAVLKYLAEGQPSELFLNELRDRAKLSWLADWKCHCEKDRLSKKGKVKIAFALSRGDDEFVEQMEREFALHSEEEHLGDLSGQQVNMVREIPPLSDVRVWWAENSEEWIQNYNMEAYGRKTVAPLVFDTGSQDARSAWMEVLLLGAAHRMGFKLCQHRGFIEFLKRKGWWDEYCEHEVSPQRWLATLDQYLDEEEFAGGEYRHWFSLFVRIYQFSKHLDTYVQLFETWNDAEECKKCDLAAIKENSKLRGTSIDAPGLQYALGQGTGLAFVYREMVRRGAIRNPLLYRFCFVPYPKVSEFGLCIRDSEAIFNKAVRELGREDATFGFSFDIAITSYIRSRR